MLLLDSEPPLKYATVFLNIKTADWYVEQMMTPFCFVSIKDILALPGCI